jgi:hypothetical protein
MIQIKNANGKLFLKFSETPKPYFLKSLISKRGYGTFWLLDAAFLRPWNCYQPAISNIRFIRDGM